jgi:hypothetical protein
MSEPTRKITTIPVDVDCYRIEDEAAFTARVAELERQTPWSELTDEQRQALVVVLREGMFRMLENPQEWIPHGLIPVSNDRVALLLTIKFDDIDQMIFDMRLAAERQVLDQRQELTDMVRGLLDGGAHDTGD